MSTRRADLIPGVHASTVGELRAFHEAAVTRAATYLEGQIEDIRRDLAAGRIPERPILRGGGRTGQGYCLAAGPGGHGEDQHRGEGAAVITQLLVLTETPEGTIPGTWADTKVWTCDGCGVQLTSADLHGTSAESVIDHEDDCTHIASVVAAAVEAERQRILEGAEKLKSVWSRPGHGFGPAYFEEVGMVPWDELADLIQDVKP